MNAVYFRATFTLEKVKKEEPEFVSMGVATPVSGFDTIKRAETRVADTDTYKGRVQKLPQDEMVRIYRCHRVLKVDQNFYHLSDAFGQLGLSVGREFHC